MAGNKGPMLKGKPSPSLRRMRHMDADELQGHIHLLEDQAAAHERRVTNLRSVVQKGQADRAQKGRLRRLEQELDRLYTLIAEGKRLRMRQFD
jgi:hypothetical protein